MFGEEVLVGIVWGRSFGGNCLGKKFWWELSGEEVLVGIVWGISFSVNCLGNKFWWELFGEEVLAGIVWGRNFLSLLFPSLKSINLKASNIEGQFFSWNQEKAKSLASKEDIFGKTLQLLCCKGILHKTSNKFIPASSNVFFAAICQCVPSTFSSCYID